MDLQFARFCGYGFFTHLRFFDPFFMLFLLEMEFSFLQIGLLYGLREGSIALLEVPTGIFSDLLGRRRALVLCFTSYLLSFALFYAVGGRFGLCALAMVLFAVAEAFRSGAHKGLMYEYVQSKRLEQATSDYFGKARACSQVGSAACVVLAGAFVFSLDSYRVLFLATLVPYALDLLLILSYPRELGRPRPRAQGPRGVAAFVETMLGRLRSERELRRAIAASSLISASYKAGRDYIQPILQSAALALPILTLESVARRSAVAVSGAYLLIYLVSFVASLLAGRAEELARGPSGALNGHYALNAALYLTSGLGLMLGSYAVPVVCYLGVFAVQNFQEPVMVAYLGRLGGVERMSTLLSVENGVRAVWAFLFAPALGYAAETWSVGAALLGFGAVLLAAFPWVRTRAAGAVGGRGAPAARRPGSPSRGSGLAEGEAFERAAFRRAACTELTAAEEAALARPETIYEEQREVLAVHWHPEFVPLPVVEKRLHAMFPNRADELVIPTQHNRPEAWGGYVGLEMDCYARSFRRKVQLLLHFRRERLEAAGALQSMWGRTSRYRVSQLWSYLEAAADPVRLRDAAARLRLAEEVVGFVGTQAGRLASFLRDEEQHLRPEALRNRLVRDYFDHLREVYPGELVDDSQALLRLLKQGVKEAFDPTAFYDVAEVIEEVRAAGGGVVIPHPEQFWPILLADYDVDGYEVWNPQSRDYTEFLVEVVLRQNRTRAGGARALLVFMGDDTHFSEKLKPGPRRDPEKGGREVGVQEGWDHPAIRRRLADTGLSRSAVIREYRARLG